MPEATTASLGPDVALTAGVLQTRPVEGQSLSKNRLARTEQVLSEDGSTTIEIKKNGSTEVRKYLDTWGNVAQEVSIERTGRGDNDPVKEATYKRPSSSGSPLETWRVQRYVRRPEDRDTFAPESTVVADTDIRDDTEITDYVDARNRNVGRLIVENKTVGNKRVRKSLRAEDFGVDREGKIRTLHEEEYDDQGHTTREYDQKIEVTSKGIRLSTKETDSTRGMVSDLDGISTTGSVFVVDKSTTEKTHNDSDEQVTYRSGYRHIYSDDPNYNNSRLLAAEENSSTDGGSNSGASDFERVDFKYSERGKILQARMATPDGKNTQLYEPDTRFGIIPDSRRVAEQFIFPKRTEDGTKYRDGWKLVDTVPFGTENATQPPTPTTQPSATESTQKQVQGVQAELAQVPSTPQDQAA